VQFASPWGPFVAPPFPHARWDSRERTFFGEVGSTVARRQPVKVAPRPSASFKRTASQAEGRWATGRLVGNRPPPHVRLRSTLPAREPAQPVRQHAANHLPRISYQPTLCLDIRMLPNVSSQHLTALRAAWKPNRSFLLLGRRTTTRQGTWSLFVGKNQGVLGSIPRRLTISPPRLSRLDLESGAGPRDSKR
jgi:hypothetical protein